ncbi:MAG: NAD(P)-dependent oxidoreductase [Candidatus Competibacteraceae bacterium]|nr:NAD(P)-dependent oxidoreductase [Candidatus Competibacteraceae bacterium]
MTETADGTDGAGREIAGSKVLVAGGTGFLGGAFCRVLAAAGAWVCATHHRTAANRSLPVAHWLQADLTNADDCRRVVNGVDYVFMCAAKTSGAAEIVRTPLIHVDTQRRHECAYAGVVPRRWCEGIPVRQQRRRYPPLDGR